MGFGNRKNFIEVDSLAAPIPSLLTAFPVPIDHKQFDAEFWILSQTNGGDLVATDENDIQIPLEVSYFNDSTEEALLWVLPAFVSASGGDKVRIYFNGNGSESQPIPSDPNGSEAVWDVNYLGVFHTGAKVGAGLEDSTSNSKDFTQIGSSMVYDEPGQIGRAVEFPGLNSDYFNQSSFFNLGVTNQEITFEAWFNTTAASGVRRMLSCVQPDGIEILGLNSPSRISTRLSGTNLNGNTTTLTLTWYHSAMRYKDVSPFDVDLFLDGIIDSTGLQDAAVSNANDWNLGIGRSLGDAWDGSLGEVRISNNLRTDDWIEASRNTQENTNNMWVSSGTIAVELGNDMNGGFGLGMEGQIQ